MTKQCVGCGEVKEFTHIIRSLWVCSGCGAEANIKGRRGRPPALTPDRVALIREKRAAGASVELLAREFCVSLPVVYHAIRGNENSM